MSSSADATAGAAGEIGGRLHEVACTKVACPHARRLSEGLDSTTMIVIIATAVAVGIGLLAIIAWCVCRRRAMRSSSSSTRAKKGRGPPLDDPSTSRSNKLATPSKDRRYKGDDGGELEDGAAAWNIRQSGGDVPNAKELLAQISGQDASAEDVELGMAPDSPAPKPSPKQPAAKRAVVDKKPSGRAEEEEVEEGGDADSDEDDDDDVEEEDDDDDDDFDAQAHDDGAHQWWFYVSGGKLSGPFTPRQMKETFLQGTIGHQTMVRWLPVCYEEPKLEDQSLEATSPLGELKDMYGQPPFMQGSGGHKDGGAASPKKKPKAKRAAKKAASKAPPPLEEAFSGGSSVGIGIGGGLERNSSEIGATVGLGPVGVRSPSALEREREDDANGGAEEGGDEDADGSSAYWFYRGADMSIEGPFTPGEMKQLYLDGKIGNNANVRFLPVCYSEPSIKDQWEEHFSPLAELCGIEGPPFMSAALPKKLKRAPSAKVRERVNRARHAHHPGGLHAHHYEKAPEM